MKMHPFALRHRNLLLILMVVTASVLARSSSSAKDKSLSQRWWNWQGETPPAKNPVVDPTGAFCSLNQPKDLWFVAGTFGGVADRSCTVPAGRDIVGPVLNLIFDPSEPTRMDIASGGATFDGKPVKFFEETIPTFIYKRIRGNPPIVESSIVGAHGYWFRIPAPKSGKHTLVIDASSTDGFRVTATYRLTVR